MTRWANWSLFLETIEWLVEYLSSRVEGKILPCMKQIVSDSTSSQVSKFVIEYKYLGKKGIDPNEAR